MLPHVNCSGGFCERHLVIFLCFFTFTNFEETDLE